MKINSKTFEDISIEVEPSQINRCPVCFFIKNGDNEIHINLDIEQARQFADGIIDICDQVEAEEREKEEEKGCQTSLRFYPQGAIFNVFYNEEYIGYLVRPRADGIWVCYPKKRTEDIDKMVFFEIDKTLKLLNRQGS